MYYEFESCPGRLTRIEKNLVKVCFQSSQLLPIFSLYPKTDPYFKIELEVEI